jgi:hypothetical protein
MGMLMFMGTLQQRSSMPAAASPDTAAPPGTANKVVPPSPCRTSSSSSLHICQVSLFDTDSFLPTTAEVICMLLIPFGKIWAQDGFTVHINTLLSKLVEQETTGRQLETVDLPPATLTCNLGISSGAAHTIWSFAKQWNFNLNAERKHSKSQ